MQSESRKVREQQAQFEADRQMFWNEIAKTQQQLDQTIANHRTEAQSYQQALKRQEDRLLKQQREFEKERQEYTKQLQNLRQETAAAQKQYEALWQDGKTSNEALRVSYDAYKELKTSLDQYASKQPPPQTTKKVSLCVIA